MGPGTSKLVRSGESPELLETALDSAEQASTDLLVPTPADTGSGADPLSVPTVAVEGVGSESPITATDDNAGDEEPVAATADSGTAASVDERSISEPPITSGTTPGGVRMAERPRNNPTAADLLDHWGHRRVQSLVEGLALSAPTPEADATGLETLRAAVQTPDGPAVAPDLQEDDEVRVLGAHRGVTYGRWTGGQADTLSIEFDVSRAGTEIRDNPTFQAMLERAGKAWSHRIVDDWAPWTRSSGTTKGRLLPDFEEIQVGAEGEISTGVEIHITSGDLSGGSAGRALSGGYLPPGESWEPRFGSIEIDTDYLLEAGEAELFSTLTHEIGHVLGAWQGGEVTKGYAPYTDEEAGTWTGPNVVAIHGGPAPFQDAANTHAWVDGERDSQAEMFDFAHSGVCASVMAYCSQSAALRPFLPHAIDFAFLADLGMTIAEETERAETYGLAGWTDHAGFTLAVSRDLRVDLAGLQPHYDSRAGPWQTLDVTDVLQVGVDAFGNRSAGDLLQSYPLEDSFGKVCYAGGLIGAAIDDVEMPPVTGDANLAVDLDTLDGTASFTSLAVHTQGAQQTFADGALYYPFALSGNRIVGTGEHSTLSADFYGPAHEDLAGTLLDPRAGLLASFGATHDDRPNREEVIAAADHLVGISYQLRLNRLGANAPYYEWFPHQFRCESGSSCQTRDTENSYWNDWTEESRENVLAATADWDRRDSARLVEDRGFVRIERQSDAYTDGRQGRHVVDGYTGTMEHSAFGVGFERVSDSWTDTNGTISVFGNAWAGSQGAVAGGLTDERARWSGLMWGYLYSAVSNENPLVEGRATVDYYSSTNLVDVAFSEIASRDGLRALDDFGFDDIRPEADGTFASSTAGNLNGALFGPGHEEAAGTFHHYEASVTGSFGARRMPDTVTLEETGTVEVAGTLTVTAGTYSFYSYDDWGFWGRQFGENLFGAFLEDNTRQVGNTVFYQTPTTRISGTPSGSNPVDGSAVWNGSVRALDSSQSGYLPVSGDAQLEVDFDDTTIDVDFTNFDTDHDNLSWEGMQLTGGSFQDKQYFPTIEGAFYGSEHQGVAGSFDRDNLEGVFGAVRN